MLMNEHDKFHAFARDPGQCRQKVVRDKARIDRRQTIEFKILSTPLERFFGKVNIDRSCSDACGANRERAGIGKTIQKAFRSEETHLAPIFSLIDKKPHGEAAPEVDSKSQLTLHRVRL